MAQVDTKNIPEVKSLRWLANMFPKVEKPKDDTDKISTCIHLYCTAGANLLEDYRKKIEFLTEEYHKMRANRDSMVDVREVVKLQEGYKELERTQQLSKKNICELVIPFRDRYGLTDLQALRIARKEMDLAEIIKALEGKGYPTCLNTLSPCEREIHLLGRWKLPKEGENHEKHPQRPE